MIAIQTAKRVAPIDWTGVPASYRGKLSAVCRTLQDCDELPRWFGSSDFMPNLPVMVMVPGADGPTLIAGMGYATAAELRDCAVLAWSKQVDNLAATGSLADFDALREKHGLMRREEVDAAAREAMRRRVAQHRANPRTDPFRQMVYPNPKQRMNFPIRKELCNATE